MNEEDFIEFIFKKDMHKSKADNCGNASLKTVDTIGKIGAVYKVNYGYQ